VNATPNSPAAPRVIHLDERDNVVVCVTKLDVGETVVVDGVEVVVATPVPFGHKLAIEPIETGGAVRKYGETVGIATEDIGRGAHVHTHNVVSSRLPGRR
jgi:hypothetical protein